MKIAILGAAGVRTPPLVRRLLSSTDSLGLGEISLMDIDGTRLALMKTVIDEIAPPPEGVALTVTTDVQAACQDADFVIFTMRVGDIAARIIDERVPLRYGVLGQETTGPGGFAMALRTIPVAWEYME
ncbi:MAG: glycoside hydrolase, partial [Limnochordia bacterium]